jgi:OOP family OmpA-OmpF porin
MKYLQKIFLTTILLMASATSFLVAAADANTPTFNNNSAESLNSYDAKIVSTLYKDLDEDGVQDQLDHCPNTLPGVGVGSFGCELDADQDGVFDRLDQCPGTPTDVAVNVFGCESDQDGDGVLDSQDACSHTPAGLAVNTQGCVPAKVVLTNIVFNTAEHTIRADQAETLKRDAATLNDLKEDEVLLITGHTDAQGAADMNERLSWRRANSTKQFIINELNLSTDKVYISGQGEMQPMANNTTVLGRQENRRIELKVILKSELPEDVSLTLPSRMENK